MVYSTIHKKVVSIIKQTTDKKIVRNTDRLIDDLHISSLDELDVFVKIEDEFNIKIRAPYYDDIETVGEIVDYVNLAAFGRLTKEIKNLVEQIEEVYQFTFGDTYKRTFFSVEDVIKALKEVTC